MAEEHGERAPRLISDVRTLGLTQRAPVVHWERRWPLPTRAIAHESVIAAPS